MKTICQICFRKFKSAQALAVHDRKTHKNWTPPTPKEVQLSAAMPQKISLDKLTVSQAITLLREQQRLIKNAIELLESHTDWTHKVD